MSVSDIFRLPVSAPRIGLALLLCAVTLALFQGGLRYETAARQLLPNLSFEQGFGAWRVADGVALVEGDPPMAVVTVGRERTVPYLMRTLPDPQRFQFVRVAADVASEGLVPGRWPWQRGRIYLYSYGSDGARLRFQPSEVAAVDGTTGWRHHEAVVPVGGNAALMRLFIFSGGKAGAMSVRNVELDAVVEAAWVRPAFVAAAVLWSLLVVWAAVPLLGQGERRWHKRATVVVGVAMMVSLLAPQPQLSETVGAAVDRASALVHGALARAEPSNAPTPSGERAATTVPKADGDRALAAPPPARPQMSRLWQEAERAGIVTLRKREVGGGKLFGLSNQSVAHLVLHTVLAALVVVAFPSAPLTAFVVPLLTTALALEVIQTFSPTRGVQLEDAAFNGLGILLGMVIAAVCRRLVRGGGTAVPEPAR